MKAEKLYKIILGPHVTEKTTYATDKYNQICFKVSAWATKTDIAKALNLLFKVKPLAVQTTTTKGKAKRFKGVMGVRSTWKKAVVRLPLGQDVNLLDFE